MKRTFFILAMAAMTLSCGGTGRLISAWKVTMRQVGKPDSCYRTAPVTTTSTDQLLTMDWELWQEDGGKVMLSGSGFGASASPISIEGTLNNNALNFVTVTSEVTKISVVNYTETKTTTYTITGAISGDQMTGKVSYGYTDKCDGTCTAFQGDPDCAVDYPIAGFEEQVEAVHPI
jgi:hypothetical protein